MKAILIECPKCKGKLEFETSVKKATCLYCRSDITFEQDGSGDNGAVDALIKRGFLALEFSDWEKAIEVFDKATDIEPENARSWLGKLLATLYLNKEEDLRNLDEPFDHYDLYLKTIRFADAHLKKQLTNYNQAIRNRNVKAEKKRHEKEEIRRAEEKERQLRLQKELEISREAKRVKWEENRPKRKKILLISGFISFLVISAFLVTTLRNQNAERNRVLEATQTIQNRIDQGYNSWEELMVWANQTNTPYKFRNNSNPVSADLLENINNYGWTGAYISSFPEKIETDGEIDVVLVLNFSDLTYRRSVAELFSVDATSNDAVNLWLQGGGLALAEEEFDSIIFITKDQYGNISDGLSFYGNNFISMAFEIDASISEKGSLTIIRTFESLVPSRYSSIKIILSHLENMDKYTMLIPERQERGLDMTYTITSLSRTMNVEQALEAVANVLGIQHDNLFPSLNVRLDIQSRAQGARTSRHDRENLNENTFTHWEFTYSIDDRQRLDINIIQHFDIERSTAGFTRANFELISNGMTLDDVNQLIGRQGRLASTEDGVSRYTWFTSFTTGDVTITVSFRDGVVIGKSQEGW